METNRRDMSLDAIEVNRESCANAAFAFANVAKHEGTIAGSKKLTGGHPTAKQAAKIHDGRTRLRTRENGAVTVAILKEKELPQNKTRAPGIFRGFELHGSYQSDIEVSTEALCEIRV